MPSGKSGGAPKRSLLEEALRVRSDQGAARGGAFNPQDSANLFAQEFQENQYTPLDFAKQVGGFPGKVYEGADNSVRGLIDLAGSLFAGEDPGMLAEQMVEGTIENWSDPVEYANENPFGFMMDATMLGGAAGLADNFLFKGRMPVEGPQSIGAFGRRLESGDVPTSVEPVAGMYLQDQLTSSAPDLALARYGDDAGLGVVKPDFGRTVVGNRVIQPTPQGSGQAASSMLNAGTGNRIRMPGAQYGDFPYRATRGFPSRPSGIETRPGALVEYVPGVRSINSFDDWTDAGNPAWAEQMRSQNIFDQVIGNDDVAYGANMFEHEGLPIALDEGIAFKRQPSVDTFYDPQAWHGQGLNPGELEYTQSLIDYLKTGQIEKATGLPENNIWFAIERAMKVLEDQRLNPQW